MVGEVIVPPACNVPPVNISVLVALPSPRALVSSAFNMPTLIVVAPEYWFVPVSVSVPEPILVSAPVVDAADDFLAKVDDVPDSFSYKFR